MDTDYRLKHIIETLENHNYQTVIVGGAVRNHLLKIEINDYDLASAASLDIIANLFKDTNIVYRKTLPWAIKVNYLGFNCEISQFRSETDYVDRIPQTMIYKKEFKDDVLRRDFSINAIGYSLKDGYLDYVSGLEDIKNKTVRVIGNPSLRFKEDPIRMLRALRLASFLNFKIEKHTLNVIKKNYNIALNTDSDHVAIELKKILAGQNFDYVYKEVEALFKTISNGKFNNVKLKERTVLNDDFNLYIYLRYVEKIDKANNIYCYLKINKKTISKLDKLEYLVKMLLKPITYENFVIAFIEAGHDSVVYIVDILNDLNILLAENNLIYQEIIKNGHLKISDLKILPTDLNLDQKDAYKILEKLLKMVVLNEIENKRSILIDKANQLLKKSESLKI